MIKSELLTDRGCWLSRDGKCYPCPIGYWHHNGVAWEIVKELFGTDYDDEMDASDYLVNRGWHKIDENGEINNLWTDKGFSYAQAATINELALISTGRYQKRMASNVKHLDDWIREG